MESEPRLAIYPGTFDPVTNGHVSLIKRGLRIFDQIVFAIAEDSPKKPMFTVQERIDMAKEVFQDEDRIIVESFKGLLVQYAERRGANAILRGLRAISDFEGEFQLALMNRKMKRDIQTVFLMTDYRWLYISSTIIKEVACLGGDINGMVPAAVKERLYERCPKLKKEQYGHK